MKTSPPKTNKRKWPRQQMLIAALVLVIAWGGFTIWNKQRQVNNERHQFKQAEAAVAHLADQIQAKVGKADQVKVDNSCAYASRKFERGPLGCGVGIYIAYGNRGDLAATTIMQNVSVLANGDKLQSFGDKSVNVFNPLNHNSQTISQDIKLTGVDQLTCGAQYVYPLTKGSNTLFSESANDTLIIEINCGGKARAEYYRLK